MMMRVRINIARPLGAAAALVVALLSYTNQVAPATFLIRSGVAFVVFAAMGYIVERLLVPEQVEDIAIPKNAESYRPAQSKMNIVVPGASVAELLAEDNEGERHPGASN